MKRDEFEKNLSQLLNLLKKILKTQPPASGIPPLANFLDQKHSDSVTFNLCFFNFLPISPEEMEELEEAYNEAFGGEAAGSASEGDEFTWNQNDIEFLKRNGMKF